MTLSPASLAPPEPGRAGGPGRTSSGVQVRIARATSQLERTAAFYRDGLGFAVVDCFREHAGYSGLILAMPGGCHLELTQHARGRGASRPDADDLLVLYLPSDAQVACFRRRLERLGHVCVPPVNPYWLDKGATFQDPDGWRVVLCDATTIAASDGPTAHTMP